MAWRVVRNYQPQRPTAIRRTSSVRRRDRHWKRSGARDQCSEESGGEATTGGGPEPPPGPGR